MFRGRDGWADTWEEEDLDGERSWEFKLTATAREQDAGAPFHAFYADIECKSYVWDEAQRKNMIDSVAGIHHSEHTSLAAAVKAVKRACHTAILLRKGPRGA